MTPGTAVDFSSDPPRWRLTTGAVEAEVVLGPAGLSLVSLTAREPAIAWQCSDRHPITSFALAGERTGSRVWRLRSWDVEEEDRARRLVVALEADGGFVLTESIWLAVDLPVLRRWVEIRNEGSATVELARYHLLDLAVDLDPAVAPLDLFVVDAFAGHRKDRWEPGDANFATHERRLRPGEAVRLTAGAYQRHCAWLAFAHDTTGLAVGLEYDGAAEFRLFDVARTAGAAPALPRRRGRDRGGSLRRRLRVGARRR